MARGPDRIGGDRSRHGGPHPPVVTDRGRCAPGGGLCSVGRGPGLLAPRGAHGEQWLPLVVRWLVAVATGGHRRLAAGPGVGRVASRRFGGGDRTRGVGGRSRPGGGRGAARRTLFDGLEIIGAPPAPEQWAPDMGMVIDRAARTAPGGPRRRGATVSRCSATCAGFHHRRLGQGRFCPPWPGKGPVHRVQWTESCLPDAGDAVRRHRAPARGPWSRFCRRRGRTMRAPGRVRSRRPPPPGTARPDGPHRPLARSVRPAGGGRSGTGAVPGARSRCRALREDASLQRLLGRPR